MKGFTIKCNECGKETTYEPKTENDCNWGSTKNNSEVTIYADRDGDTFIECNCGNVINHLD